MAIQLSATVSIVGGDEAGGTNPGVAATKIRANRPPPARYTSPLTGHDSWARNATIGATCSGSICWGAGCRTASSPSDGWVAIRVEAQGAIRLILIPCR